MFSKYFYWNVLVIILGIGLISCQQTNIKQEIPEAEKIDLLGFSKTVNSKEQKTPDVAVLYRSIDLGKSWLPFAKGIPSEATLSGILQVQSNIFITTDYHGVYKSERGFDEWKPMNIGLPPGVDINCIVADGDNLIIGTLNEGVYLSRDNGLSWKVASKNINNIQVRAMIHMDGILIAGTDSGIYQSEDQGDTWSHLFGEMQILGFTFLNNKVYAAAHNGALLSTDKTSVWKYIYEEDALHDIANDGTFVYGMPLGKGLIKTKDDGATWESAQNGIPRPPNFYTNELKYVDNNIFSAQWIGVYQSIDNGSNWKLIEALPDSTAFSTLEITDFGMLAGVSIR